MKDEAVLKKLYELHSLTHSKEREAYINKWIEEIQFAMAEESAKNVGFGSGYKTIKKILTANKKSAPELAYVLKTSKRNSFIVTDRVRAILMGSDAGLPATASQKEYADKVLKVINDCQKTCKEPLAAPDRAVLDTIVKDFKAQPKSKRGKHPIYSLGKGLPSVNAEYMMDMLAIYPTATIWYDKNKGRRSYIFFSFNKVYGVLMPILI